MCLIIFTPNIKRARIRKTILERGFYENSDGAGFAYVRDGRVCVSKPYKDYPAFLKDYESYRDEIKSGPLLIHFRWGTKGSNTPGNTQPLTVHDQRLVMAHNGMIEGLSFGHDNASDSVHLVRILRRLNWTFPYTKAQQDILDALCSNRSKLVFLDGAGRYQIINESLGKWRDGSWYSDRARVFESILSYGVPRVKKPIKVIQRSLGRGLAKTVPEFAESYGPHRVHPWDLEYYGKNF